MDLSKCLYVGQGFVEKAEYVWGWECREVGVYVIHRRYGARVTGQQGWV